MTIICVSNRPEFLEHAISSFSRQTHTNKKFLFVTNADSFDRELTERMVAAIGGSCLHVHESAYLGDCLNEALGHVDTPYWAKFDDDDFYGEHHISDLMLTFEYTGAALAGRQSYYVRLSSSGRSWLRFPGREFQFVDRVTGGSFVADSAKVRGLKFASVRQGTDTRFMERVIDSGERIFSASRFNYVMERRADPDSHTWRITERDITDGAEPVDVADILTHAEL